MTKTLNKRAKVGERAEIALKFAPATDAEMKALGDDIPVGYVAGWASTPDLDLYRHVVETGAFDDAISKRGLTGPKGIKLLIGHDWDKVAGVIKVLENRNGRLWIEAQLNLNISYARDAYEAAKMNDGLNFSVGFMLQDYEFKEDAGGSEYLLIHRGDLFEISIVPFPGNEEATMEFIKSQEDDAPAETIAEFEKALIARGLAKSRNDAQRITQVVKQSAHLFRTDPETETVDPPEPVLASAKLEKLSALLTEVRKALAPAASDG